MDRREAWREAAHPVGGSLEEGKREARYLHDHHGHRDHLTVGKAPWKQRRAVGRDARAVSVEPLGVVTDPAVLAAMFSVTCAALDSVDRIAVATSEDAGGS